MPTVILQGSSQDERAAEREKHALSELNRVGKARKVVPDRGKKRRTIADRAVRACALLDGIIHAPKTTMLHVKNENRSLPRTRRWQDRVRSVRRYGWRHKFLILFLLSIFFALLDMFLFNNVTRLELRRDEQATEIGG